MTCDDVRPLLLDAQRGRLPPELEREVRDHAAACAACARVRVEEEVLSRLIEERLPFHPAPPALKRRLATLAAGAARVAPESRSWPRWARSGPALAGAAFAAAVLVAGTAALVQRATTRADALALLAGEAVNDHLRVLQREPPVDVESGGTHQVKPWFEGKLDFAPSVPEPVEPDMRLQGGAVGYFLDRPAAVIVYTVRRHVVTLLVFRTDGLRWPAADAGERALAAAAVRGSHVVLWRASGLGYALVGGVAAPELAEIAARFATET